jgi:hypothetical protein
MPQPVAGSSLQLEERLMRILLSSTLLIAASLMSAAASAQSVGSIKVDCEGECNNVRLGDICDSFSPGSLPVAVACDDTADPGRTFGTVECGNPQAKRRPTCSPYGLLVRSDLLGDYCSNGSYNDAVVTCAPVPHAFAADEEADEDGNSDKEEQPYAE